MNVKQPGIEKNRRIEDLHDLRLKTLLDDLVGDNAASRPTADLDVGHRTLAASPGGGRRTRRIQVALDRALLAGVCVGVAGTGTGTGRRLS